MYQTHDIGALTATRAGSLPAARSAGAANGAAIDRKGYGSAILSVITGAETGGPSARSSTCKIQDSADGSTGWADLADAPTVAVAAVDSVGEAAINLAGAKRYIRVVNTTAFTGGTSPTLLSAATVQLGGADKLPA